MQYIEYSLLPTSIGTLAVAATERGICAVDLVRGPRFLNSLYRRFGDIELFEGSDATSEACKQILNYLNGRREYFHLPLDTEGSPVQEKTWATIQSIPYGQTLSYSDVARKIGHPKAVRAIGSACGANPVPLIIPCHRVLGKHGIGGFGWDLDIKYALLGLERQTLSASKAA